MQAITLEAVRSPVQPLHPTIFKPIHLHVPSKVHKQLDDTGWHNHRGQGFMLALDDVLAGEPPRVIALRSNSSSGGGLAANDHTLTSRGSPALIGHVGHHVHQACVADLTDRLPEQKAVK